MIEITRKVVIGELASQREVPKSKTFEFSGDSWAEIFAALAMWSQEHHFIIVALGHYVDPNDSFGLDYNINITVDDFCKKEDVL